MIQVEEIIARIDELSKNKGWSRYKLNKMADISPSTMNNIYNRKSFPSIPTLIRICDAFGISLAEFFTFEMNPFEEELSPREEKLALIDKYENMPESNKRMLLAYIQEISK